MRRWGFTVLMFVAMLFAVQAEAATLVDNGNGTVTDKKTGLMWQQHDTGQQYSWYQAKKHICRIDKTGKYSDWRLPTKDELVSLVDPSVPNPGPTINRSFFPRTKNLGYWASNVYEPFPDRAWGVNFRNGRVMAGDKNYTFYVRCVRTAR